jgi:hypothetical protein
MTRFSQYTLGLLSVIVVLLLLSPAVLAELRRAPACAAPACPQADAPAATEEPTATQTEVIASPEPSPTEAATHTAQPPARTEEASALWNGYTDGRLNPQMDEPFSVWCQRDQIEVWRGVPSSALIGLIPIVDALALADGDSLMTDDGLMLTRAGDTLILTGANGNPNAAPAKTFMLAECLRRNGGTPVPTTATRRAPAPATTPDV